MSTLHKIHHGDLAQMCVRSYLHSNEDYPFPVVGDIEAFGKMYGDTLVVSFRGTNNFWDVIRDIRVWPWGIETEAKEKIYVHAGFYKGARDWSYHNTEVLARIFEYKNVCLTGHSLGAATAVQYAIQTHKFLPINQITLFGEPKGLFNSSKEYYQSTGLAEITTSYRQGNDKVTFVPPWGDSSVDFTQIGNDEVFDHDIVRYAEELKDVSS